MSDQLDTPAGGTAPVEFADTEPDDAVDDEAEQLQARGTNFLTDLADWLREAGLNVVEYDGWRTRCKSSGGYSGDRPWGVMWHHTASNGSAASEADFQCRSADTAPISNVTIEDDGTVWVLAAGPTNTNGKGNALRWSKGTVPNNSMNSYAFGIELCNNGVGEPYTEAQIEAAFVVSNVVNAKCGNRPDDVCTHFIWAPTRKVDPATASAVQGSWQPSSVNDSGTWSLDDLKAECLRRSGAVRVSPPISPTGDDVAVYLFQCSDADAAFVGVGSGDVAVHVSWAEASMAERYRAISTVVKKDVTMSQLQSMVLLGRLPVGDARHTWSGTEFGDWVKSG